VVFRPPARLDDSDVVLQPLLGVVSVVADLLQVIRVRVPIAAGGAETAERDRVLKDLASLGPTQQNASG
jgi:hypothetical protein